MIDAWSDLEATRSILIAVFTVGRLPPEGMDKYMNVVKRNRRYDLSMLTLPAHNPFKNISRNTDYILLNFSDNPRLFESPWDSIYLHRKVLAVIGVVHCPSNPDLDVPHEEFVSAMKQFPGALVKRCFAFEPLDSQQDLMERQNLVMVPNADTKHLQFYMNTLVMDVVERLICEMLEAARALSSSQELPYISSDKPVAHDPAKKKRLLPGRISKISADYSLLSGIVSDARELYLAAIDATKSSGDLVWRGAALEGLACCDPTASYDDRVALIDKAIRNYAHRPDTESLRIEAFLKLARFSASHHQPVESQNYLSRAFELCGSIPINDRISVVIESAILSQLQGAKRKFGMFMREAALLFAQKERWHESFSLSLLCSQVYDLNESSSQRSWKALQIPILSELVASAQATNRFSNVCMYLTQLLTRVKSSVRQKAIVSDLCRFVPLVPKTQNIEMIGVPVITRLKILPIEAHLIPKSREPQRSKPSRAVTNQDDDVFLFRPSAMSPERGQPKGAKSFDLSVGQFLYVDVTVRNPLLIELPISSLFIECDNADYESFPISLTLKPLEENNVRIAILPLSVGIIQLSNVSVRLFGIETHHKIDRLLDNPVPIRICSAVPLLKVQISDTYRGFFGQALSMPMVLHNVGEVAANDINLIFEDSNCTDSAMLELKQDSDLILRPGQSASVYVVVDCCMQKIGSCNVKAVYAAEKHSEMYRELTFRLPIVVDSGLSIRSFEVYPVAQYQLSGKFPTCSEGLLRASFGPEDCMVICEVVNSADFRFSVSVPGHKELKYEVEAFSTERIIFPFRRKSFGVKIDERIVALASDANIMHDSTGKVEEYVSCRNQLLSMIVFNWKKCCSTLVDGQIAIPASLITPSHLRYIVPDPFVFQFELDGSYDPHRRSASSTTTAISSPVSPCLHSPNFRLNSDYLITGGYHHLYPRGQFVNIKVLLSVRRATPMSMTVKVRPSFQQSSGQFDYDLKHRLLWTGSWDHNLGLIQPDSCAHLTLNVCFIAIGRFMFELICRCEQAGCSPIVYSCSLPLLIETFDQQR